MSDDDEITAVVSDLEDLMAALRGSVHALEGILTSEPEVAP